MMLLLGPDIVCRHVSVLCILWCLQKCMPFMTWHPNFECSRILLSGWDRVRAWQKTVTLLVLRFLEASCRTLPIMKVVLLWLLLVMHFMTRLLLLVLA